MLKFYSIVLLLSFISTSGYTQYRGTRAQSVFGEFGGNGLIFSVNYDTRFGNKQSGIGGRAGVGFFGGTGGGGLTFPLGFNYLAGKNSNYLEAGLGVTILTTTGQDFGGFTGSLFFPSIGFKY